MEGACPHAPQRMDGMDDMDLMDTLVHIVHPVHPVHIVPNKYAATYYFLLAPFYFQKGVDIRPKIGETISNSGFRLQWRCVL